MNWDRYAMMVRVEGNQAINIVQGKLVYGSIDVEENQEVCIYDTQIGKSLPAIDVSNMDDEQIVEAIKEMIQKWEAHCGTSK